MSRITQIMIIMIFFIINNAYADLTLELKQEKEYYSTLEPINLTVSLNNEGYQDELAIMRLTPRDDFFRLEIMDENGDFKAIKYPSSISETDWSIKQSIITISPGDKFSTSFYVFEIYLDDNYLRITDEPGKIKLRAIYRQPSEVNIDSEPIISNIIEINVKEAEAEDASFLQNLKELSKYSCGFLWGGSTKQIELYEKFITEHSDSYLFDNVQYQLALAYDYNAVINAKRNKILSNQYDIKAIACYDILSSRNSDNYISCRSLTRAARCLARIGNNEGALKRLETLFYKQDSTEEDKIEVLSLVDQIEYMNSVDNEVEESKAINTRVLLPLVKCAKSIGYSIKWDFINKEANASLKNFKTKTIILRYNSKESSIKDGVFYVKPTIIAELMAKRYGKGVETALKLLLAKGN